MDSLRLNISTTPAPDWATYVAHDNQWFYANLACTFINATCTLLTLLAAVLIWCVPTQSPCVQWSLQHICRCKCYDKYRVIPLYPTSCTPTPVGTEGAGLASPEVSPSSPTRASSKLSLHSGDEDNPRSIKLHTSGDVSYEVKTHRTTVRCSPSSQTLHPVHTLEEEGSLLDPEEH